MKILLSHSGKQHSYWVAKALNELHKLAFFQTSVYVTGRFTQMLLNVLSNSFWSRRYIAGLSGRKVQSHWRFEFREMILRLRRASNESIFLSICTRDGKFDHHVAKSISSQDFDVFWGFQGSSLESIKAAKEHGRMTICEQTAVYFPTYSAIYEEEMSLKPEWAPTIRPVKYSTEYHQRLIEEPLFADYVIAASNFTRQSLIAGGIDASKILVLSLGFDTSGIKTKTAFRTKTNPLKILFVGRLTQEKGLSYLLDAVNAFSSEQVELHLIGGGWYSGHPVSKYLSGNVFLHRQMSQPRLWEIYKEYDLLVLPSLSEGFGMVIVEALVAGVPVIASENTIGNDIISNGVNGYVVPIRNVSALKDSITAILSLPEKAYMDMSKAAKQSAEQFSWDSYKSRLSELLQKIELESNYRSLMFVLSHAGKQHSYYVARGLKHSGNLQKFHTSGYLSNENLQSLVHKINNTFWSRRFIDGLGGKYVNSNWRFELKEYILRCKEGKSRRVQDAVYERDVKFDEYISKTLSQSQYDVFWGFQGSCFASLMQAKKMGKIAICELATAHVIAAKQILGEEALLHPEWADSIDNLVFPAEYEKRLVAEPQIADYCIVASEFTRKTLLDIGIDPRRIYKIPLGFDVDYIACKKEIVPLEYRPLRLLYAGTVTQRKGIKYLLEAMKAFTRAEVELHIIGGVQGSGLAFEQYKQYYIKHNPVSQLEMFRTYKDYDALVLPSVFEGFGLVIVEAMAAGLPVITTEHSIGPELIINGKNGYIVPIRNTDALIQSITALRKLSTEEYSLMSMKSIESSTEYSWGKYEMNLNSFIKSIQTTNKLNTVNR